MAPAPNFCAERQRLTQELREAIRHLLALHNCEIQAAVGDRILTDELHPDIERARKKKFEIKLLLSQHIGEHGCE